MKKIMTILFTLTLAVVVFAPAVVQANGQAGTTLSADVSITPHWTSSNVWTIDKSVTPVTWNLSDGQTGTSTYTITVTKSNGSEAAWIDGVVCITNGGAVSTENLAISVELRDGVPPPNDVIKSVDVDVSGYPILSPGETHCYSYHVSLTGGEIHAGGTYKVTANVTITNHSGHLRHGELLQAISDLQSPSWTPASISPIPTWRTKSSPVLILQPVHRQMIRMAMARM